MTRVARVVVLFAKWPGRGRAKRRLARAIGSDGAARLARSFLQDTVALVAESGSSRLVITYAPPTARRHFARLAPHAHLVAQPRGTFGTRLRSALAAGLADGRRVALIGADSPTLPPSRVRRAFAGLRTADVALAPASDGGYVLIATRAALPTSLFRRMPWSTRRVMRETVRRAHQAGLRVAVLPAWYDVDDAAGLRRLRADRRGMARARATREALRAIGRNR